MTRCHLLSFICTPVNWLSLHTVSITIFHFIINKLAIWFGVRVHFDTTDVRCVATSFAEKKKMNEKSQWSIKSKLFSIGTNVAKITNCLSYAFLNKYATYKLQ